MAAWPLGLAGFPANGGMYGLISSGNTDGANDPNAEENKTTGETGDGDTLDGLVSNEGNDLAGLNIGFTAPALASPCSRLT